MRYIPGPTCLRWRHVGLEVSKKPTPAAARSRRAQIERVTARKMGIVVTRCPTWWDPRIMKDQGKRERYVSRAFRRSKPLTASRPAPGHRGEERLRSRGRAPSSSTSARWRIPSRSTRYCGYQPRALAERDAAGLPGSSSTCLTPQLPPGVREDRHLVGGLPIASRLMTSSRPFGLR